MADLAQQQAQAELEKGFKPAEKLLKDTDALERLLQRLESKLRVIPLAGDTLANIPVLVSLTRSFVKKEYTDIPIGSIIAIVSALLHFASPVDLIPDIIPGIGHIDDTAVIAACLILVKSDVTEYVAWRKKMGTALSV